MTYDEKVKYLREYINNLREIDSLADRIDKLDSLKYKLGGSVIKSYSGEIKNEKQLSILGTLERMQLDLEKKLNTLHNKLFEIEQSIEMVENETQQSILKYRYLNDFSYKQIAIKMYYSEDYIFVLHKKAIEENEFVNVNGK